MPWKETCAMDERIDFIAAWRSGEFTMTELCQRFEVSRPTGYKWVRRDAAEGRAGLQERARAPHHHPNATPAELRVAVLAAAREDGVARA